MHVTTVPPQSGGKRTRADANERKTETLTTRLSPACSELRGCGRTNLLGTQPTRREIRLRVERGPSPQELVKQASLAARLQDLD